MSEVDMEYTAEPETGDDHMRETEAEFNPPQESPEAGAEKIPVMPEPVVYNYKIAVASDQDPLLKVLQECAQLGRHGFRFAQCIQTGKKVYMVMEQKLFIVPDQRPHSGLVVPA